MKNKQDITVALKGHNQQRRATPCGGNVYIATKPQRGVIRPVSFDSAPSGLDERGGFLFAGRCPALLIIGLSALHSIYNIL
ncbi:MAG: hypothetical protein LBC47_06325 [Tannerella sp.]|jgi:hypothetical protein|nr:hypothetical protein [Tannerella sp.]